MLIDSHQHFWQLQRGDYFWLKPELTPLYRDFLPKDLAPILSTHNIEGTILVQAAPTTAETHFMLQLAKENPFILGVVGWIDMMSENANSELASFMEDKYFCGIRPMIQDIEDPNWMLQKQLTSTFKLIEMTGKTFDALILPKHLPILLRLLDKHPDLNIVIDHGAKPPIKSGEFNPWSMYIEEIAKNPNVFCKFSGLVTEANANASWDELKPYIDHLFSCFGYHRMMWGSDFPVLNLVSNYHEWFKLSQEYVTKLGKEAYEAVFGNVAAEFYGIDCGRSREMK